MGTAQILELGVRLPVHGRLREDGRLLVLERSFQAKDSGELAARLDLRRPGESLFMERFATYWLVRFTLAFPLACPAEDATPDAPLTATNERAIV